MKTEGKGAAALKIFSNPLIIYGLGGLLIYFVLRFLLPDLFKSSFTGAKKAFNDQVDNTLAALATISGRPASQVSAERRWYDSVRGLWVQGDRALSDLIG